MRILVFGKDGQVGRELARALAPLGENCVLGRADVDLTDVGAVRHSVREYQPNVVINAAAYTAVDKAESEYELAHAINARAPQAMADEAAAQGAWLIHYSTDYVFDGSAERAYQEQDSPNPLNVYGITKLAGERAVIASGAKYLILRTSWVYGVYGRNFVKTMLRLARERDELSIVDDQIGAPTWSRMIAETTACMLSRLDQLGVAAQGIYHMTAGGKTSWRKFAEAIFKDAGMERRPRVRPIMTADYPTPARRPLNSMLDNSKFQKTFGLAQPDWHHCLRLCLQDMRVDAT